MFLSVALVVPSLPNVWWNAEMTIGGRASHHPVSPERSPGTSNARPRAGLSVGTWTLRLQLGSGGNGDVWLGEGVDGATAAIKLLRTPHQRERMDRFRQEVSFLLSAVDTPGVLRILESELRPLSGPPWYAMPVADPLRDALGHDPTVELVIEAFASFSATLARLHEQGIGHRDLKPANLFGLDGQWVIGDFGLVQYPDSDPLTKAGRRLGPIDFMAPEMRDSADTAQVGPADVFSFAKALWAVLSGVEVPLPGPHRLDDEAYSLVSRVDHRWAPALDSLLRRATFVRPEDRLTMEQLHMELRALRDSHSEAGRMANLDEVGTLLRGFADPERQRIEAEALLTQRLDRSSGPPHQALEEAYQHLSTLLSNWHHTRKSDEGAHAYRLMDPPHWPHRGQRGREDEFWLTHPSEPSKTIIIRVTVAVRLKSDGETLVIAGGVTYQEFRATAPDWTEQCVREVPLGSSLELEAVEQLRVAFAVGIEKALRLAASGLL